MIYTCKHCKEEVTDHIINHICDGCYRKLDYYKRLSEAAEKIAASLIKKKLPVTLITGMNTTPDGRDAGFWFVDKEDGDCLFFDPHVYKLEVVGNIHEAVRGTA